MSFYTSLSGLKNAQTSLGVISHNIANAETEGFKKSALSFSDIAASGTNSDPRKMVGIGSTVKAINQNFTLGPIVQTGSALDVAISGDGFFTTQSADSGRTLYTRAGHFSIDELGYIQDGANNRLQIFPMDLTGAPDTTVPPQDALIPAVNGAGAEYSGITINELGIISASYADGSVEPIGAIALASFLAPTGLRQTGSANWTSTGVSGPASYGMPGSGLYGSLMSGALERSNVDLAEELVGLITAQRSFQANAKAIDTATQVSQTIINLRS